MSQTAVLDLAMNLMARPSVTPKDLGCQAVLAERLTNAGFEVEHLRFGKVHNLWARRGSVKPLLIFAGHTDVVPPGPEDAWDTPPFEPTVHKDTLYGRGAADMKAALAAMQVAAERFVAEHPDHQGSLGFLITSDEEGPARDGTRRVIETLLDRGETPDWCVVGEPSSQAHLGDMVRHGRRGSLTGYLAVQGIQGHVAYPDKARNPIHAALAVLDALAKTEWDQGNADFPPTSFQIAGIEAGTGAANVIPGTLNVTFNLRYSPASTAETLKQRITGILDAAGLDYCLDWHLSGKPFHTPEGPLLDAVVEAVRETTGSRPALSTGGGTSDGRFIAPAGAQVVELGLINETIHQVNENTPVADLEALAQIYQRIMELLLLAA